MSDFGEGTWHTGRKDHRCEYCGQMIPKGEEFYHYRGIYHGEWQNWRMHWECHDDFRVGGDYEFSPYSADRPEKIGAVGGAHE